MHSATNLTARVAAAAARVLIPRALVRYQWWDGQAVLETVGPFPLA